MRNSDVVIRVEGLGKTYNLHHDQSERYMALRDVVACQTKELGRRLLNPFTLSGQLRGSQRQASQSQDEEFWALKDVNFEICRGERVGIIGRNGAGKSTLLKILSRITEPTAGRVEIRGRVASLLEVGTGFHPELTGRENIYLNGAILGMTRWEIRSKFDEIVDFAEVERFLDTPVKRYSSGMYVRLAFAVAAHLEPEILVVDEVLAVGDSSFQKKCLGKMEDVAERQGRTVLFVSHNLEAIRRFCQKCIYLRNGLLESFTEADRSIHDYLCSEESGNKEKNPRPLSVGFATNDSAQILIGIRDDSAGHRSVYGVRERINVVAYFLQASPPTGSRVNFHIKNSMGNTVFCSISNVSFRPSDAGSCIELALAIPATFLNSGRYYVSMYLTTFSPTVLHSHWEDAISFEVEESTPFELHQGFNQRLPGDILLSNPDWKLSHVTLLQYKLNTKSNA
jgi:lipopolysaccharide transport system ATP-binding protein